MRLRTLGSVLPVLGLLAACSDQPPTAPEPVQPFRHETESGHLVELQRLADGSAALRVFAPDGELRVQGTVRDPQTAEFTLLGGTYGRVRVGMARGEYRILEAPATFPLQPGANADPLLRGNLYCDCRLEQLEVWLAMSELFAASVAVLFSCIPVALNPACALATTTFAIAAARLDLAVGRHQECERRCYMPPPWPSEQRVRGAWL